MLDSDAASCFILKPHRGENGDENGAWSKRRAPCMTESHVGFPTLLPEPDGHLSMHPVLRLSNASGLLNHFYDSRNLHWCAPESQMKVLQIVSAWGFPPFHSSLSDTNSAVPLRLVLGFPSALTTMETVLPFPPFRVELRQSLLFQHLGTWWLSACILLNEYMAIHPTRGDCNGFRSVMTLSSACHVMELAVWSSFR